MRLRALTGLTVESLFPEQPADGLVSAIDEAAVTVAGRQDAYPGALPG
jgi:hypothetical protein